MLGWIFRFALKLVALSGFIYFAVFVKLGKFTLYEHVTRVAGTEEAQELKVEVSSSVKTVGQSVVRKLGNPDGPTPAR